MAEVVIVMVGCEETLLQEIACPELKQRDIAQSYHLAIRSDEARTMDWGRVNRAIIARWSVSGLERIKQMALSGRCFAPRKTKGASNGR